MAYTIGLLKLYIEQSAGQADTPPNEAEEAATPPKASQRCFVAVFVTNAWFKLVKNFFVKKQN